MATLSFETAILSPGISDYIESSNIELTIRSIKYIKITNSTNRESKNCIQMQISSRKWNPQVSGHHHSTYINTHLNKNKISGSRTTKLWTIVMEIIKVVIELKVRRNKKKTLYWRSDGVAIRWCNKKQKCVFLNDNN